MCSAILCVLRRWISVDGNPASVILFNVLVRKSSFVAYLIWYARIIMDLFGFTLST